MSCKLKKSTSMTRVYCMGAKLPDARSPWALNFVLWLLLFVGPQFGPGLLLVTLEFRSARRFSEILYGPVFLYFLRLLRISLNERSCYYLFYL